MVKITSLSYFQLFIKQLLHPFDVLDNQHLFLFEEKNKKYTEEKNIKII